MDKDSFRVTDEPTKYAPTYVQAETKSFPLMPVLLAALFAYILTSR